MCASGIPVSSEGWEELRSVDTEVGTRETQRSGAGESGKKSFCFIFSLDAPKSILNTPIISIFSWSQYPCV